MRTATVERSTAETRIRLTLALEGKGIYSVQTGCGFLDHMLELFSRHGRFDLALSCEGDTRVDCHHTVEDCGLALGEAFRQALGDKRGIQRYGSCILPMDETLLLTAVDLSGRTALGWQVELPAPKVGDFDTELAKEFWLGFVRACPSAFHFRQLAGENTHHILEACFKSAGRSLGAAAAIDAAYAHEIPSTKGVL